MPDPVRSRRLAMDSRLEHVARAGHAVREFCLAAGLDAVAAADMELAAVEAANNILLHGFAGAADARYQVIIKLHNGEVQVLLSDGAPAIPPEVLTQVQACDLERTSARGLIIIRACSDRFEYRRSRGRNHLLLGKRLPL